MNYFIPLWRKSTVEKNHFLKYLLFVLTFIRIESWLYLIFVLTFIRKDYWLLDNFMLFRRFSRRIWTSMILGHVHVGVQAHRLWEELVNAFNLNKFVWTQWRHDVGTDRSIVISYLQRVGRIIYVALSLR